MGGTNITPFKDADIDGGGTTVEEEDALRLGIEKDRRVLVKDRRKASCTLV